MKQPRTALWKRDLGAQLSGIETHHIGKGRQSVRRGLMKQPRTALRKRDLGAQLFGIETHYIGKGPDQW